MNKFYCVSLFLGFVVAFVWTAPQNSPDTVVELTSVAPNASSTSAKPFVCPANTTLSTGGHSHRNCYTTCQNRAQTIVACPAIYIVGPHCLCNEGYIYKESSAINYVCIKAEDCLI